MDSCEKVLYDNSEMTDFLRNFPVDGQSSTKRKCEEPGKDWTNFFEIQDGDVGQSLVRLENDVTAIRSQLERKVKKITLSQIDAKLDTILNILMQNGANEKECTETLPINISR